LLLLLALVVLGACSGGEEEAESDGSAVDVNDDAPATTDTPTTTPDTTEPPGADTELDTAKLLGLANHPNGAQLVVHDVVAGDGTTLLAATIINGGDGDISLDNGDTSLLGDDGAVELADPEQLSGEIAPGATEELELEFDGNVDTDAPFDVVVNDGGGASESNRSTDSPSFRLTDVDSGGIDAELPASFEAPQQIVHPNGTQMDVTRIAFSDTRIGVEYKITNGGDDDIKVQSAFDAHQLQDDLGSQWILQLPEPGEDVTVPGGSSAEGVLSFAGRVDPRSSELTLVFNEGGGASAENEFTDTPTFQFEPWSLDGSSAGGSDGAATRSVDLADADELSHPNGTQFSVSAVEIDTDALAVTARIANGGEDAVSANATDSYIEDDQGNRYPLQEPADNPELDIEPGQGIDGQLRFSGRLPADASEITILMNEGGGASADNQFTDSPSFVAGPYPVSAASDGDAATSTTEPSDSEPSSESSGFEIPERSTFNEEAEAASEVETVALILSDFNAERIDDGILFTVPENVLFDFDQSDLRPDAEEALAGIAEVLAFYEGEPVTIIGHTDSKGTDEYNINLSQERAATVLGALIDDHDIPADRLSDEGRGEAEPVAPNENDDGSDNPEGRQQNRRVEFCIETDQPIAE